jgi:DNA-binding transcriptional regulator LsrR (DeoR family)
MKPQPTRRDLGNMSGPASAAPRLIPVGQLRLITKVARMYHERGIRQVDIAETLHLSQARVSRLLKRANELGIVRTVVVQSQGVHTELEEALEDRYKLAEVLVVDVEGDDADILAGLGSAGASYLESTLTGGERIGISTWSQTLLSVVERMHPLRLPGADNVVQLIGGIGVQLAQAQANRLLGDLAQLLGANATFVAAPGLVANRAVRDSLLGEPGMRDITDEWAALTMCLVGIGSLPPSEFLQASGNAVDPEDQTRLSAAGAVGDVCHRFFDRRGAPVVTELDDRVVGIGADALRSIPRRIGIAGGLAKREAVHAAVLGGWVNVLITDIQTAHHMLAREG